MKGTKKNFLLILLLVLLFTISGCKNKKCKNHVDDNLDNICDKCNTELECNHKWIDASCEEPKTCSICKVTEGSKLDHKWIEATYTTSKTCSICKKTEGIPLIHNHVDTDLNQLCDLCNQTYIVECSHEWIEATCKAPKTCEKCGTTEGTVLEHSWADADYINPKTCQECGTTEGDPIYHEHVDKNEDNICEVCEQTIDKASYRPKWVANKQTGGFNGNGMVVKILVYPVSNYDPFNENYKKEDKIAFQKQIRNIEKSYGIDLEFVDYPLNAVMNDGRTTYIRDNVHNGSLSNNDIYIASIESSLIRVLIKSDSLVSLYNSNDNTGPFAEIGYIEEEPGSGVYIEGKYVQDEIEQELTSRHENVYGYVNGNVKPDKFIYFNVDLIEQAGLTDPAELWLKGQWTWNKLEEYCTLLQTYYGNDKKILEMGYADFVIGSYAGLGNKIATTRPSLALTTTSMIEHFKTIQNMKSKKICYNIDLLSGSVDFVRGDSIFTQTYMYLIENSSKITNYDINFKLGVVPFPTANDQGGTPITTQNANEAIQDKKGNPIKLNENEYISGVDMTNSSYLTPIMHAECFSILNSKERKNNISDKVLFAILYDLYESYSFEEKKYETELLEKFDEEMYVKTIMSVQNKTYFELIERVSVEVGGGSNWSYSGFWSVAGRICSDPTLNPSTVLNEVLEEYKAVMRDWPPYIIE